MSLAHRWHRRTRRVFARAGCARKPRRACPRPRRSSCRRIRSTSGARSRSFRATRRRPARRARVALSYRTRGSRSGSLVAPREGPQRYDTPDMTISLGVDTLCWHMRLSAGAITIERVLEEAVSLEVPVVALNLHHVRERSVAQLRELHGRARSLRLRLLAQGDFIGTPRRGDEVSNGVTRIHEWVE